MAPSARDDLTEWLLRQAVHGYDKPELLLQELGERLVAQGVPVDRIASGGLVLHPVHGATFLSWDRQTGDRGVQLLPRAALATEESTLSPFHHLSATDGSELRLCPKADRDGREFPVVCRLWAEGFTDYLALHTTTGSSTPWMRAYGLGPGVAISYATRAPAGFAPEHLELLRQLALPYAAALKGWFTHQLSRTLLRTYLGGFSGNKVLDGRIERGDAQRIECVLWYCDMRDSTPLADALPMERYLERIDAYLDAVASSVLDHDGEVLRFIGDAMFSIFPLPPGADPAPVATAARDAALEAIRRVAQASAPLEAAGEPPIRFGIGLHAGAVMYGNIGTDRRLEFSVTGPAANEVARLEGLCKGIGHPILASEAFQALLPEPLEPRGRHQAAGIVGGLATFAVPIPGSAPGTAEQ